MHEARIGLSVNLITGEKVVDPKHRAAARLNFGTFRRSSVSLFIVRLKRREGTGMNDPMPDLQRPRIAQ